MIKSGQYYLAHPFNSRDKIRKWEKQIVKKYDFISFVNPFRHALSYDRFGKNDVSGNRYYKRLPYQKLIPSDISFIAQTKGVVAIIDKSISYGTIMEIVYAYMLRKPIYIICTNKHNYHPWLKYHATKIYTSFRSFEKDIKR